MSQISTTLYSTIATHNTLSLFPQSIFLLDDGENRKILQDRCENAMKQLFENSKSLAQSKELVLNKSPCDEITCESPSMSPTVAHEDEFSFGNCLIHELHKTEKKLFDQSLDAFLWGITEAKSLLKDSPVPLSITSSSTPTTSSQQLSFDSSTILPITPSWAQMKEDPMDEAMKEKLAEMFGLKTVKNADKEIPSQKPTPKNAAKSTSSPKASSSEECTKGKKNFTKAILNTLNSWFYAHVDNPYPDESEKKNLAKSTGLKIQQINNWFGNKRMRYKRKLRENSVNSSNKAENNENLDDSSSNSGDLPEESKSKKRKISKETDL